MRSVLKASLRADKVHDAVSAPSYDGGMSLDPVPALYAMLHSGDQAHMAQAIEMMHALELSSEALTERVERLLRANHTAQKRAGRSALGGGSAAPDRAPRQEAKRRVSAALEGAGPRGRAWTQSPADGAARL